MRLTHDVHHGLNGMCVNSCFIFSISEGSHGVGTGSAPASTGLLSSCTGSSAIGWMMVAESCFFKKISGLSACTHQLCARMEDFGNSLARTYGFCESSACTCDFRESLARTHDFCFCTPSTRTHDFCESLLVRMTFATLKLVRIIFVNSAVRQLLRMTFVNI